MLITDGSSSEEDQSLLCGTSVTGFPGLNDAKNTVRFSTVRIFEPRQAIPACSDNITQTACKISAPASMCPAGVLKADAARLAQMAALGHGRFKSFEGASTVDYSVVIAP